VCVCVCTFGSVNQLQTVLNANICIFFCWFYIVTKSDSRSCSLEFGVFSVTATTCSTSQMICWKYFFRYCRGHQTNIMHCTYHSPSGNF